MQEKDASIKQACNIVRNTGIHDIFASAKPEELVRPTKSLLLLILSLLTLPLFSATGRVFDSSPVSAANRRPAPDFLTTSSSILSASPAITATPITTEAPPSGPPLSLTLMLLFTCCALGLVLGVLVVGYVLSIRNRKGGKDEKLS